MITSKNSNVKLPHFELIGPERRCPGEYPTPHRFLPLLRWRLRWSSKDCDISAPLQKNGPNFLRGLHVHMSHARTNAFIKSARVKSARYARATFSHACVCKCFFAGWDDSATPWGRHEFRETLFEIRQCLRFSVSRNFVRN